MIRILAEFLARLVALWLRDRRATEAERQLGAATSANETAATIGALADDQHKNTLRHRGDARDVARRLRERLDRLE